MKYSANAPCPCSSGKKYKKCCKIYHDGARPKSALLLMRSRYSAFALHKAKYIIHTTHPQHPEYSEQTQQWKESILQFCRSVTFEGLEILDFTEGTERSSVTFRAKLSAGERDLSFCEDSLFLKEGEKWLYHSALQLH